MKVLVAKKLGFCFGVRHAIDLAQGLLENGEQVYCLGPLIHNNHVVERLAQNGLNVVDSLDEVPQPIANQEVPTVLIRSHGCRPEILQEVEKRGLKLADATCVLVKKAQKLVSKLHKEGYKVVVIGDPKHPEIKGVVGYAPEVVVVADEGDLVNLPDRGKLAIISQTTISPEEFGRLVGLITARNYQEIKAVSTICHETSHRQASAIELCGQVDVMFVLGSNSSANTCELADLCSKTSVATYHLQTKGEFKSQYIEGHSVAGITAGASTPDWIIQEFVEYLDKL